MNENNERILGQHLTARDLLTAKGICSRLVDEYNQVTRVLPKTGVKLFEPNGSWLQNKQIDTCLSTRKDLIKIERVNRLSALAVAEWLPLEKRAKVTKRSGVEWNNYGNDIRGILYLIPEEALLLLELNCIELLYDGLPLSIQQAYDLLLDTDDSCCTLSEYRVFSQLARLGYRLQRFQYKKSSNGRPEEIQSKKKIIIDPDNGRWMGNVCDTSSDLSSSNSVENESKEIQMEVEEIINDIVGKVEVREINSKLDVNIDDKTNNETKVKVKPRVEIISEETVLEPVKLVISPTHDLSGTLDNKIIKWSGARIQRNVKLLPKRMDKKILSPLSTDTLKSASATKSSVQFDNGTSTIEKRKAGTNSLQSCKKSKQEIIELSDDGIEEIPRTMSRMEMLNCIPNIASKNCITQIVLRGYIPHSIKPQKNIYEYDHEQILRIRENNKSSHVSSQTSTSKHNNSNDELSIVSRNSHPNFSSSHIAPLVQNNLFNYNYHDEQILQCHRNNFHQHAGFLRHTHKHIRESTPNSYVQNYIMNSFRNNYMSNLLPSFQANAFRNIAMVGFALRSAAFQNNTNSYQMMCNIQRHHRNQDFRRQNNQRNLLHQSSHRQLSDMQLTKSKEFKYKSNLNDDKQYQASFVKMSADSWSELKKKWKELKTITIEDEDDKMDCTEVEVVQCNVQPLINAKNVKNFSEVYDRLRIIKSAQSKTVRRKRSEYKISYKVYSNTQRFKKSDPGTPLFHLVITSRAKNFLQPVDLNKLQQDGECESIIFAYVSDASISFMQAGLVSLPNLTNT